ncbi:BTAD domain-containing putative transcriptional regulator [Leekyejoonella antrihumi]|uniref:OmpR/PhoB-type domain-containing protein n=1 Tax=Leekyejoonella antrihumi TaxID=1660198 RepID=A0A563DTW2_9MICO|nr:BTAD domain-containing putative transcriptional regulator [Leekyejoonella antrihumi]TWP33687.1 hypothetical protein FGL98_20390 [Leekyejoonella antrihumi]
MQIHDLGSLWVESDGVPLPLADKHMAAALSALVVDLDQKVRSDVLIDAIWGEDQSRRASAALDTLMGRLRRVLDPERSPRATSTVLRTVEQGYRLTVPGESVDSWAFSAAVRKIEALRESNDTSGVLATTAAALALWRGRPYDDVADDGWLQTSRARLTEQHLSVQQSRVQVLLEVGQPEQALAELIPALAEHPFVERLWECRMLGLYQAGRASAAVEAYSEVAGLLDRELGTTPGAGLQRLRQQVRQQDPTLARAPQGRARREILRIPRHRTSLVGRSQDVDTVGVLLQQHRLVSIIGPVGCGKTRLATAVAERVEPHFPDGVYFVDLSDVTEAPDVADRIQETLHIEGDSHQPSTQAVAGFLAERTVLLVLDNCEQVHLAAAALVEALGNAQSVRILTTSRRRLEVEDEYAYALRPLGLPSSNDAAALAVSPAVMLFTDRAASHGMTFDLAGPQGAQIARICQATDGLPLGIELAAARIRTFQLHEIVAAIRDDPTSLGDSTILRSRGHDESTLRDSIEWSHGLLTEQEQAAHRRLSVLPSRFTLEAAVAVCTDELLPVDMVPNALIGLADHCLLEATQPERPDGPSLFRQLVPIRAHAASKLTRAGEGDDTAASLMQWVIDTVAAGPRMGQSDHGRGDQRLQDNRRTITAALESAIAVGPTDEVVITLCRLVPYWWLDGNLSPETVRLISTVASTVGAANSEFAVAAVTAAHGSFLAVNEQDSAGPDALSQAIKQLLEAPAGLQVFAAELLLAVAAACWVGGDLASAESAADGVAEYGERLDDDHLRVLARGVRCAMGLMVDPAHAGEIAQSVLLESRKVGNTAAAIMCLHTLYMSALFAQDGPAGLRWTAEAIRCQQDIGQRNAAATLEARGSLFIISAYPRDAVRCYGAAYLQYSRLGRSWQLPGTEALIETIRGRLSRKEFDEAWTSGERLAASDLAWV